MKLTPGMEQYMKVKNQHPDCLILFRMGDFYETFFEDAKIVARELEITLTARGKGESKAPLAGLPYHALDPYLTKLLKKGYKVGIVEQTEDPKKAKGLVKRELVRIITPGTTTESLALDQEASNYLLSFVREQNEVGFAYCDISTGECFTGTMNDKDFLNEVRKINPAEIIFPSLYNNSNMIETLKKIQFIMHPYEERFFYHEKAEQTIKEHFKVTHLSGLGITDALAASATGGMMSYLKETQKNALTQINTIKTYNQGETMALDFATIRNLEITKNLVHGTTEGTLLKVLDKTITPMGKRLLKKWMVNPLIKKEQMLKRIMAVSELKDDLLRRKELTTTLTQVYDIERLITKVAFGNANPKDLISLRNSLISLPKIKRHLQEVKAYALQEIAQIQDFSELSETVTSAIKEEPNTSIVEGNIIKEGYNTELDELREVRKNVKEYLSQLEEKEKEKTGIKSLKIKFNKVFGYYIEVTKANLHLVPSEYIRKQTQVNTERFITEELKEKEAKILGAEERINELEQHLFLEIIAIVRTYVQAIQETARKVARLDCFISFATTAEENKYTRPIFSDEKKIELIDVRHPSIEKWGNEPFIPNSCVFQENERTKIITGPNAAGKSTYLRSCALLILMAQMGSFVPATKATLPIIDRIFSRIGAYDDLIHGQSTFVVEMTETANILNNATENSFIILDEIGRGTSTFDGVALAWAIAEHLNNTIKAKTLFATHYHHLNEMSKQYEGIHNYHCSINETEEEIIFLRKIVEGGTDKSYGIQVAKISGVPKTVIEGAKKIMNVIEAEDTVAEKLLTNLKKEEEKYDTHS